MIKPTHHSPMGWAGLFQNQFQSQLDQESKCGNSPGKPWLKYGGEGM